MRRIALLEFLIFISCILGVFQVYNKSGLPFKIYSFNHSVFITSYSSEYPDSSKLISINGILVKSIENVEFILDGIRPGEIVDVKCITANHENNLKIKTVPFYSRNYLLIYVFTGFFFFFMGVFVFHRGKNNKAASVFHWASLSTAVTILCTWGNYKLFPIEIGIYLRFLFHLAYLIVPVLFFHFSIVFPRDKTKDNLTTLTIFYISAFVLFVILGILFITATKNGNSIMLYLYSYNILRVFVLGGVLSSIIIFSNSFRSAKNTTEKKKLKWLLLGFITGPLSYVFLWVIPQAYQVNIVPEEIVLLLMISVPVTFTISIIKYHILDVDLVFNRSIVYSIVLIMLSVFYLLVIYILTSFLHFYYEQIPSVISAFLVVLVSNPLKKYVQLFVDRKFFHVHYTFREALNSFFIDIKEANDLSQIGDITERDINNLISLNRLALISCEEKGFNYLSKNKVEELDLNDLKKIQRYIKNDPTPFAITNSTESDVIIRNYPSGIKMDSYFQLLYPLLSQENRLLGYLLIGEKKSNQRFSVEDCDLLKTIALRISLMMERMIFQKQYIIDQLEKEKLAELDKLKSFFISGISHELKTPITSVKMYAELLAETNPDLTQQKEYIGIIDGECDRLTRLIDNLLDISRIERGEKKFRFIECDLANLLKISLKIIEYLRKKDNCKIDLISADSKILFYGDPDAIISAIVNLLSNAIKYSYNPKKVRVEIGTVDENIFFKVSDNGPGISSDDSKLLMTPYFRTKNVKDQNIGGMGVGLALVKHIIEGHNGKIEISSSNEGSCFVLLIPQKLKDLQGAVNEKNFTC